jgi:hypothetical protein
VNLPLILVKNFDNHSSKFFVYPLLGIRFYCYKEYSAGRSSKLPVWGKHVNFRTTGTEQQIITGIHRILRGTPKIVTIE